MAQQVEAPLCADPAGCTALDLLQQGPARPVETSLARDAAERLVSWIGFEPQPGETVATAQLIFDALPSLLGAFLVGLFAYWAIHRNQIRMARDSRRIERTRLLHGLDDAYFDLMATRALVLVPEPVAITRAGRGMRPGTSAERWTFETALTSRVCWLPMVPRDERGSLDVSHIGNSRFIRIGTTSGLGPTAAVDVDTLTLHRALGWFKRIDRAIEAEILHPDMLADLWRNILPWATGNRFSYMADFFGPGPGQHGEPSGSGSANNLPMRGPPPGWRATLLGARPPYRLFVAPPPGLALDVQPMFRVIQLVLSGISLRRPPEVLAYLARGVDAPFAEAFGLPVWSAAPTVPLRK